MSGYNKEIELWFSDTVGKCFELSVRDDYNSYEFAKEFIHSSWGVSVLTSSRIKEYNSVAYMYASTKNNLKLSKGDVYAPYLMWMYGYLVKYWVYQRNINPKDIWKILPIDVFDARFNFYHTQGWNYIIEDALTCYAVS